jgi:hypothetical protein
MNIIDRYGAEVNLMSQHLAESARKLMISWAIILSNKKMVSVHFTNEILLGLNKVV